MFIDKSSLSDRSEGLVLAGFRPTLTHANGRMPQYRFSRTAVDNSPKYRGRQRPPELNKHL